MGRLPGLEGFGYSLFDLTAFAVLDLCGKDRKGRARLGRAVRGLLDHGSLLILNSRPASQRDPHNDLARASARPPARNDQ